MKRKNYMISSNHELSRAEILKEDMILPVYNEPDGKHKTIKKGDVIYTAYSFAADVELEKDENEEVFYHITKKIEREIIDYGEKAYDEENLISLLRKEYQFPIKNIEFVYLLKRYYIYDYETQYSSEAVNLVKSMEQTL